MKQAAAVVRSLVGALFIFSGLIKVNDPIGTAIKMEEYFEVFATQFSSIFHVFIPVVLEISVIFVVLEVVLGVALLLNYRPKLTNYFTLGLLIFFTFLTGYSAITNTVTDCGCFGDAIKLTPWESFTKDIVLMVMLGFVILTKDSKELIKGFADMIIIVSIVLNLVLAIAAIKHLPYVDFRAYKIGDHIPSNMQPSEEYIYEYVLEKEGQEYTFSEYPTDPSYKFVAMNHLNPGAAPTITDFAVWDDEGDYTEEVFQGNKLYFLIYDVSKSNMESMEELTALANNLNGEVDTYVLTASSANVYEEFAQKNQLTIPYYYTDATVLKTIARSNPAVWLLQDGVVKGKWHYNDVPNYSTVLDLLE
ncbi:MAG: DoxX family protein [Reichenbachiella sp.]